MPNVGALLINSNSIPYEKNHSKSSIFLWHLGAGLYFFRFIGFGDLIGWQLYLSVTGLPLVFLSFWFMPNGSVFGTFIAGLIGWCQWCCVVELNARFNAW